jgi:alpha,alpha-trehalase
LTKRNVGRAVRLAFTVIAVLSGLAQAQTASQVFAAVSGPYPEPPQVLFQELYTAVQMAPVYADGKLFADAIPKTAPADILAHYRTERPASAAALKAFVESHFTLPGAATAPTGFAEQATIAQHIDGLWDILKRTTREAPPNGSLLALPQPYVVPGGRFREIYYWDSYFTMLGLVESGRHDLIESMVSDFAYLIDTYGHVPNGTRSYYLTRSQPPFFFEMVGLLSEDQAASFARYLPQLKREYAFWMEGSQGLKKGTAHRRVVALPDGSILNRFWDDSDTPRDESYREDTDLAKATGRPAPQLYRDLRAAAESGWDFGSRWFADGQTRATIDTTEILPIDLNSLMFGLENAIRLGCERQRDLTCARSFAHRAAARRAALDRYQWDAALGAYVDYRWTQHTPIERLSAATLYPLFVGAASRAEADRVADTVKRKLLLPGGVVTTPLETGQQWDSPNGWAPLQWIAVAGARRYEQSKLAEVVACRWMFNVNSVYQQTGKLVEKYNVTRLGVKGGGGEYPTQDGFGWTNGVMRKLMALYPADAAFTNVDQCPAPEAAGRG